MVIPYCSHLSLDTFVQGFVSSVLNFLVLVLAVLHIQFVFAAKHVIYLVVRLLNDLDLMIYAHLILMIAVLLVQDLRLPVIVNA